MHRSPIGELAQRCWDAIPEHMPHVDVDAFVVMPNHVHGIVIIHRGEARAGDVRVRHDAPRIHAGHVPDTNEPRRDMNIPDMETPETTATNPRAKPPGIPSGALGQIVASYRSAC